MNWNRIPDSFGFPNTTSNSNGRGPGFLNPTLAKSPNGQLSWVHTFSPTILNEARAGYALNITAMSALHCPACLISVLMMARWASVPTLDTPGVPRNIYSYSDMVSISHGKHNMKVGVDFRRNIENSEFNVARPSYYLPITSTLRQMRLTRKRLEWIRESLTARVLA
jgi:hypothetical protein